MFFNKNSGKRKLSLWNTDAFDPWGIDFMIKFDRTFSAWSNDGSFPVGKSSQLFFEVCAQSSPIENVKALVFFGSSSFIDKVPGINVSIGYGNVTLGIENFW